MKELRSVNKLEEANTWPSEGTQAEYLPFLSPFGSSPSSGKLHGAQPLRPIFWNLHTLLKSTQGMRKATGYTLTIDNLLHVNENHPERLLSKITIMSENMQIQIT